MPEAPDRALGIRGLEKRYRSALGLRRRAALSGVDLELPRGAALGLVGPNGSGKSTLLRCVAGIERPSAGQVEVLGGSPDEAGVRRRLGYLPEGSPFPAELSARAALQLLGALQGLPRAQVRRRGAELLERVGLSEYAGVALRRFSRGMRRRFGLAQAWLHEPELLLLDEPTAGLDAPGFAVLDDLLAEARRGGATIVLSSHLLGDLTERCDALAILLAGRLAARGAPAELLSRPGHWRVELEGLDEARVEELRRWVGERGGVLLAASPSGKSLLEVYRELGGAARARDGAGSPWARAGGEGQ